MILRFPINISHGSVVIEKVGIAYNITNITILYSG